MCVCVCLLRISHLSSRSSLRKLPCFKAPLCMFLNRIRERWNVLTAGYLPFSLVLLHLVSAWLWAPSFRSCSYFARFRNRGSFQAVRLQLQTKPSDINRNSSYYYNFFSWGLVIWHRKNKANCNQGTTNISFIEICARCPTWFYFFCVKSTLPTCSTVTLN